MLVRDISVEGAVLDLIDNAVDAAYAHSKADGNLGGFRIEITLGQNSFKISDNCRGMDIDTATNYAFRFGRADDFNPNTRIGEFGIGMKRAVFRLGRNFTIDSSTDQTRFVVDVDVEQWQHQDGDWTFPMTIEDSPFEESGTTIIVNNLNAGVKELFARDGYADGLLRELTDRYNEAIENDLEIVLNDMPADMRLHEVLAGNGIVPLHQRENLVSNDRPVELQIVAGIGPDRRSANESGWYVYCNGRLVIKADRSALTGWGTDDPASGTGTPAWHPQYARFRGFVYFRSEHPGALPWTTTKTEIDAYSDVYQNALIKMRSAIRSFAKYTNELIQEREHFEDSDGKAQQRIRTALVTASYLSVSELPIERFKVPERVTYIAPVAPPGPRMVNMQFKVEASRVDELKDALDLSTNRQVGEEAFERLHDEEIG